MGVLTLLVASLMSFSSYTLASSPLSARQIPEYPTATIQLQSNTVYDFGGRFIYGDLIVEDHVFSCDYQSNITVTNLNVRGGPYHSLWFRGCADIHIYNVNIFDSGNIGIRFERMDNDHYVHQNVRVENINVANSGGHGLEFWDLDGFHMDNLRVDVSGNCGFLLNRNKNGHVGSMVGNRNCYDGDYATFRLANDAGPNITVDSIVSRDSGRGYATTSGAHGITVNHVDLQGSTTAGIRFVDSLDMRVLSGIARGAVRNCQALGEVTYEASGVDCGCGFNCADKNIPLE